MQALNLETKFFHWLIENPKHALGADPSYFTNDDLKLLFKIAKKFIQKYPQTPTKDQLRHLVKRLNKSDIITESKLDIIYDAKNEKYDEEWYKKTVESWLQVKTMEKAMIDASEYFRGQDITEENAQLVCNNTLRLINEKGLVSFQNGAGLDFFDSDSYMYDELENQHKFGIEYIDKVTDGGIGPGELWVYQGQTNIGKSIWLANLAKSLVEQGSNVVYVSCEMKAHKVLRRIGSNSFNVKMKDFFKILKENPSKSKEWIASYRKSLKKNLIPIGTMNIEDFPTSSLNVLDLERWLVDEVEKSIGKKIDVVLIDYINIMSNWRNPNSENTYIKIKQLAEDLRGMGSRNDWGVITLTQIKKEAYGSTDQSLSDVSESKGLSDTADVVFAIIQDDELKSRLKYKLKLIKNRDEGYVNSHQMFDIAYDYMRLTQDETDMVLGTS